MVRKIVEHIVKELNDYMWSNFGGTHEPKEGGHVVADSLFDANGQLNTKVIGRTVLSLVRIEQDRTYSSLDTYKKDESGGAKLIKPPITVNLYFLIIANKDNYLEALEVISHVIAFFQHRVSFNIESAVTSPPSTRPHIVFEMVSMSFEEQNQLWGMLGNKYMPSVLYKAGLVDIQDQQIEAVVEPVKQILINEPLP